GRLVVERAVRFDVRQARTRRDSDGPKRLDLFPDELVDLRLRQRERDASLMLTVRVPGVRPDPESAAPRHDDQPAHGRDVTGVSAAGDVDGRDEAEKRQLDQFVTRRGRLADVGVQVDLHGESVMRRLEVCCPWAELWRTKEKGIA